jgi:hypothetical protein
MAPGGVSPADDALTRIELLHQSDRARIARVRLPGLVVVRKEPLGPDAERRARHELAILERLRGSRCGAAGGRAVGAVGRLDRARRRRRCDAA